MTAIDARPARAAVSPRATLMTAGGVGAGCAVLAARPAIVAASPAPTVTLLAIFLALAAIGLVLPLPAVLEPAIPRARWWTVLCFGIGVFALGRGLSAGHAAGPWTVGALALHGVAAVSEEIWFRRVVFAWLAPAGRTAAIVGSATLFAVVHVTTYGAWVLPLDLAAGLVFAWQRDATGSWRVPAVTHVVANVLALW